MKYEVTVSGSSLPSARDHHPLFSHTKSLFSEHAWLFHSPQAEKKRETAGSDELIHISITQEPRAAQSIVTTSYCEFRYVRKVEEGILLLKTHHHVDRSCTRTTQVCQNIKRSRFVSFSSSYWLYFVRQPL